MLMCEPNSTLQLLDLIDFVFGRHGQLCRVEMMRRESVCVCERERERERRVIVRSYSYAHS